MHSSNRCSWATLLWVLAVGCGNGTDGGADAGAIGGLGGNAGGVATGGAGAAGARADAAVAQTDARADGGASFVTAYGACVAYFRAQCNRHNTCRGLAAVADPCPTATDLCPDVEFSPGSLRTIDGLLDCARAWETQPCADVERDKPPSCAAGPGSLPDGAPCTTSTQCQSASCGASDPQRPGCGQCAAKIASGTACASAGQCPLGDECSAGRCVPLPVRHDAGEPCTTGRDCHDWLDCVPAAGGSTMTCQSPPKLGQPCADLIYCADRSLCTTAHVCEPAPKLGSPCKRDAALNRLLCADDATCDTAAATPTCIARTPAGGACPPTGAFEQSTCAAGLFCWCEPHNGSCTAAGRCVRRLQEGEPCDVANAVCVPGTSCSNGRCVATSQNVMTELCGG